jgi:tocopherol cyclase
MKIKIYNTEIFQGNLKRKNYFEGWYYKHVSNDLSHVYSFIPGISISGNDSHSFIQVINGVTGETHYLTFPLSEFQWKKDKLYLKIGNSVFAKDYVDLNIDDAEIKVSGHLEYNNIIKYPARLLSPGIMGWYSFVPFMECKHGVVSADHDITGEIKINNEKINLSGGKGYIEKDWGISFPEAWIWIHSNSFGRPGTSLQFSVAKIPWMGSYFTGFISFLYFEKKFYLFSTYNNSTLSGIKYDGKSISLTLKNKDSILKITSFKNKSGELRAPKAGRMVRKIRESIDSVVMISLFDKNNNLIYNDSGQRAGLEIIDKIFDYLPV